RVANVRIKAFLCPSDAMDLDTSQLGVIDGGFINGRPPVPYLIGYDSVRDVSGYGRELGCTNYLGVGGAYGQVQAGDPAPAPAAWVPSTGIYSVTSRTRLTDVTDGTSNTLAFGEALGGLQNDGSREMKFSWLGTGWLPTWRGLAPGYGPH